MVENEGIFLCMECETRKQYVNEAQLLTQNKEIFHGLNQHFGLRESVDKRNALK